MAAFLYATRALRAPAFAFAWLQLVADKRFMPRLLMAPAHAGWRAYLELLLAQVCVWAGVRTCVRGGGGAYPELLPAQVCGRAPTPSLSPRSNCRSCASWSPSCATPS